MNVNYLVKKILGRSTCVKAASTRITRNARIINIQPSSDRINIGEKTVIEAELLVFKHGGQINIGPWCYVGVGTRIWSGSSITIGSRVLIAHNVNIIDNRTHPISPAARHRHFVDIFERGHPCDIDLGDSPIHIEDDVWIAAGAAILRGVTIGQGAIVAAGAHVTKDVAPYCIVAGNPAAIVRHLSAEEITGGAAL